MTFKAYPTTIPEVRVLEPAVYRDARGFFLEAYHSEKLSLLGVDFRPVQINRAMSAKGILRGLHAQLDPAQAKIISVVRGEIFNVGVDLRRGSPTFARWTGVHLTSDNFKQLFLPVGFANGFVVLSETAEIMLLTSAPYTPEGELTVNWDDPEIGVEWPVEAPVLSEKDSRAPLLSEVIDSLPAYKEAGGHAVQKGCFISYAGKDADFAGKLYGDLMAKRIPCWWAPEDMSPGDRMRETFQSAIRSRSDFLLVLSANSLRSDWVQGEVEVALEWERESGQDIIRPVSVDKAVFKTEVGWAAHLRRTRHIADFSAWQDEPSYHASLEKLMMLLRDQNY